MERENGGEEGFKEVGEFGVIFRFLVGVNGKTGNGWRVYYYSLFGFEYNFVS